MPSFPLGRLAWIVGCSCALLGCDGSSSQVPKLMNLVAIVAGTASTSGGAVAGGTMIRVTPINVEGPAETRIGTCAGGAAQNLTVLTDAKGRYVARFEGRGLPYRLCLGVQVIDAAGVVRGTASRDSLEWATGDTSAAADTIYVDVRVAGS
jgi:hypothetical protein